MKVITTDSTQSGLGAVYNNKAIYVYNNGSALKLMLTIMALELGLIFKLVAMGGKLYYQMVRLSLVPIPLQHLTQVPPQDTLRLILLEMLLR